MFNTRLPLSVSLTFCLNSNVGPSPAYNKSLHPVRNTFSRIPLTSLPRWGISPNLLFALPYFPWLCNRWCRSAPEGDFILSLRNLHLHSTWDSSFPFRVSTPVAVANVAFLGATAKGYRLSFHPRLSAFSYRM